MLSNCKLSTLAGKTELVRRPTYTDIEAQKTALKKLLNSLHYKLYTC